VRRSGFARRQQWKKRRSQGGGAIASTATLMVHAGLALVLILSRAGTPKITAPVYRVELVAAPLPEPGTKKAPEVLVRPAASPVAVPKKVPPIRSSVAKTPPPPNPKNLKREPAPRSTTPVLPGPGVKPSTGNDITTVKTSGVDFQYPEYLRNIVAQVYRRWQRPTENLSLRAEVLFLVHRDGTVTGLQFMKRSGSFAFDLEAQGAVEAAANAGAFGRLPDGYQADVLPVSFFFDPETMR
jgi:outer membrane biosynthesis protein TonB